MSDAKEMPRAPLPVAPAATAPADDDTFGVAGLDGSPVRATAADDYVGKVVAERYHVLRRIGHGGMGVVYLAEHVDLEKKVALKFLPHELAQRSDLVQRFMQEAKAASRIGHPNIVDVTDFGRTASGTVFLVMEYLEGRDLAQHIRSDGPFTFERARRVAVQICRALDAAHGKGIVHRDLKPENVFLVDRDQQRDFVKILDFGAAKMTSLEEANGLPGAPRLTRAGMVFGTPEYMAPEQASANKPDHRVDVYALGCILYEMLTATVPFKADTLVGVLTKQLFEPPESIADRAPDLRVPGEVERIVMKALAKEREQRFQSMRELEQALLECTPDGGARLTGQVAARRVVTPARAPAQPGREPPPPPNPERSGAAAEDNTKTDEMHTPLPPRDGNTPRSRALISWALQVDLLTQASSAVERGDFEMAYDIAERAVSSAGIDAPMVTRYTGLLESIYTYFCGPLDRTVAIAAMPEDLDSRAAFLLSRIDGSLTLDDLIDVSAMPRLEALRLLALLLRAGALATV